MRNRNFKITKGIIDKFGTTEGCKGCDAHIIGLKGRQHSIDCRARIESAMADDDMLNSRLTSRDARLGMKGAEGTSEVGQAQIEAKDDADAEM